MLAWLKTQKTIITHEVRCDLCRGDGILIAGNEWEGSSESKCPKCHGRGVLTVRIVKGGI